MDLSKATYKSGKQEYNKRFIEVGQVLDRFCEIHHQHIYWISLKPMQEHFLFQLQNINFQLSIEDNKHP